MKPESQAKVDPRKYILDQSADAEVLPTELIPFVYSPYLAYSFEESDLNQDGLKDYILVLAQAYQKDETGEDDISSVSDNAPAPVLIILRQKDKTLKLHSKNEVALTQEFVQPRASIYAGIEADTLGNGFNFYYHSEGAGATASYSDFTYHFVLDKKSDYFYLTEAKDESGMVSPGGAREFMLEKTKTSDYTYDTTATSEVNDEPEINIRKYKPNQYLFTKFEIPYLKGEDSGYE